jgi:hypothetical protein
MTTTPNEDHSRNTPRTRNRLLDNTRAVKAPEGYDRGDWTFRKQLEADFRALGFKSHKFSHKNEPETRAADSLWLSWNSDNKKQASYSAVTDIEVRVTFGPYFADHEAIITVTHEGRTAGGCMSRRMGKATFVIEVLDSRDVIAHVQHLLTKPYIR